MFSMTKVVKRWTFQNREAINFFKKLPSMPPSLSVAVTEFTSVERAASSGTVIAYVVDENTGGNSLTAVRIIYRINELSVK